MGVLRWLDRIDPDKWTEACERLRSDPPLAPDEASAFLESFGRASNDLLLESFEDVEEEPDLLASVLNDLLEEAVKEDSWELDKSLSSGFEKLPVLIPALKPLRKIIDFRGIDREPPGSCSALESGLFGCISPENLDDCLAGVLRFPTISELTEALRRAPPGFLARAFGRGHRGEEHARQLEDEYYSGHWANLRAAIEDTVQRGHLLGLGMSV